MKKIILLLSIFFTVITIQSKTILKIEYLYGSTVKIWYDNDSATIDTANLTTLNNFLGYLSEFSGGVNKKFYFYDSTQVSINIDVVDLYSDINYFRIGVFQKPKYWYIMNALGREKFIAFKTEVEGKL